MKIVQVPNAIPKAYQDQVEAELGSSRMSWNFHDEAARSDTGFEQRFGGFSHMAFLAGDAGPLVSPMSSLLLPILFVFCEKAEIPYQALLRIRVGLFTKTMLEAVHHNPHVDFEQPHHTAVYYVSDSDGDTFVFAQTTDDVGIEASGAYANAGRFEIAGRVSPKKGTMMCFDGRHYHASMHPMKAAKRITVTFNFV